MGRTCSTIEERRNACRILVGKPQGRPRSRWVNSIKIDLKEVGWGHMNWIDLAYDRNQ
jgi:hypothetical protein